MSAQAHPISDERLTAYLDDTLGPEARAQIDAALAEDADLAARLSALDVPISGLKAVMSPEVIGAPQMPAGLLDAVVSAPAAVQNGVTPQQPQTKRRGPWVPMLFAASFAAGIALTYVLTADSPEPSSPKWVDAVASYQALYVTETLSGIRQDPTDTAQVLARAADNFGLSLTPALALDGLEFKRAQMLGWNGKPLLQIAYLTEDGTPMALCMTRVSAEDRGPKTSTSHSLAGVSWVENGVGYYLVGGDDTKEVESLSDMVIARL